MPTPPRQRFDNRLNKLHRELRRTRTDYSELCPKRHAQYAISQIQKILERDIATHSAIFRAQNEFSDLLAAVAFSLESLPSTNATADVPTKWELRRFLASDVNNLIFVWFKIPPRDKEAIRAAVQRFLNPVLRRGIEMLTPLNRDERLDA